MSKKFNRQEGIALRILILEKIKNQQDVKNLVEDTNCTKKDFEMIILNIEDYLKLLKKVNDKLS